MGLLITFAVGCLAVAAIIKYRRYIGAEPIRIKKISEGPRKVAVRVRDDLPTKDEIQTFMWDLYHRPDFIDSFRDR